MCLHDAAGLKHLQDVFKVIGVPGVCFLYLNLLISQFFAAVDWLGGHYPCWLDMLCHLLSY